MAANFKNQCTKILDLAVAACRREAKRLQVLDRPQDGDYAGVAGRSERHFQSLIFEELRRTGFMVTVEESFFGERPARKPKAADLVIRLGGRADQWLWTELKYVRPGFWGFMLRDAVRADISKLDAVAKTDDGNLPQGVLVIAIRDDRTERHPAAWHWNRLRGASFLEAWPLVGRRIVTIPMGRRETGELLVAMWARIAR